MHHPRTELIPYLRGELPATERDAIEAHLAACAECRAERDAFADLMLDLRRSVPDTPAVDWARWRGELRARLPRRTPRRPWLAPVSLGAAAAAVAAALLLAMWPAVERSAPPPSELVALDLDRAELQAAELPDDIDLIVQLDHLAGGGGS